MALSTGGKGYRSSIAGIYLCTTSLPIMEPLPEQTHNPPGDRGPGAGKSVRLRQLKSEEVGWAVAALTHASLPTSDISDHTMLFGLFENDDLLVGTGGLEAYGVVGLLRSVSVAPEKQGSGYGKYITKGIETFARSKGVGDIYLLTTTASDFFQSLGYQALDRRHAPRAIQTTAEFSQVCPSTAAFLHKKLFSSDL